MSGFIKILSLLSVILGIAIAAYLYVSRVDKVTQVPNLPGGVENTGGATNPIDAAQNATDKANDATQQRLQDAQNQLLE